MKFIAKSSMRRRRGVAAVEFAAVMPFLLVLIIGIWELGRIIHVEAILNNAARDGARLAAQANIVTSSGTYTTIKYNTGTPNFYSSITAYLKANGITDQTGMTIELQFVTTATGGAPTNSTTTDPYLGVKNQRFRVRITLPYQNVRWTTLTLINPTTLSAETYWQNMNDDPFTLNATLPGW